MDSSIISNDITPKRRSTNIVGETLMAESNTSKFNTQSQSRMAEEESSLHLIALDEKRQSIESLVVLP